MKHRVVGLASCIFNGGKDIFSLQEGEISKNFFKGSPARQEIQNVGNTKTKTPNAGAASALSFFHGYSLQPLDAHELEVYDGLGQRARKSRPSGRRNPGLGTRDTGYGTRGGELSIGHFQFRVPSYTFLPTMGAIILSSFMSCWNWSGKSDCAPSLSAFSGSL